MEIMLAAQETSTWFCHAVSIVKTIANCVFYVLRMMAEKDHRIAADYM